MSTNYILENEKSWSFRAAAWMSSLIYLSAIGGMLVYLWLFMADRYQSSAEFKITQQSSTGLDPGLLQLALPGFSESGSVDSQIAIGYISSSDLLISVEEEFDLADHFSSPVTDPIFRLEEDATLEDRLEYYRKRISAHYNVETGMTSIVVSTYDPQLSKKLADALLEKSEKFVNKINKDIADQQLEFVESEVKRTEDGVNRATAALIAMQNTHNFISPEQEIASSIKAVEGLKSQLIGAEAQLSTLLRDSPDSPMIDGLRSRLRSIEELIGIESAKLSGSEKDRLNLLSAQFKRLQADLEFAIKLRAGAEVLLEKNRAEAVANSRFLTVIQRPYLPESATYPDRTYATVTILVLGALGFAILRTLFLSAFERL